MYYKFIKINFNRLKNVMFVCDKVDKIQHSLFALIIARHFRTSVEHFKDGGVVIFMRIIIITRNKM